VYSETLKELHRTIQNKRRGMLSSVIVVLHENQRPHTSTSDSTQLLLQHFYWELFDHPPYSPVLAPSYYHLFTYLKNWLGSQHFKHNHRT
jgi:hypothetical protein